MSREELREALTEFVVETLGVAPDQVVEEASYQGDLDADSLDLVEMIMEVEEGFGIKISDEDSEKMVTVGDSLDYLEKRQQKDGAYTIKQKD